MGLRVATAAHSRNRLIRPCRPTAPNRLATSFGNESPGEPIGHPAVGSEPAAHPPWCMWVYDLRL